MTASWAMVLANSRSELVTMPLGVLSVMTASQTLTGNSCRQTSGG
jgi:hypothetical protein